MKTIIIVIVALIVLAVGGKLLFSYYQVHKLLPPLDSLLPQKNTVVKINNKAFEVSLAKSPKEREAGLSGRKNLSENSGMLFEFERSEYLTFWMKDMKFPVDILYIQDNRIVTILQNIQNPKSPDENLLLYQPTEPANRVLEINAGLSEKYNIKVGDTITVSK